MTAGNSSPLSDGAAALLLTTPQKAEQLKLKPMVRIVASAGAGVHPNYMGIGPIPATQKALKRAGLTIDQIDAALRALSGRILQRPPIYSAHKRGGEPLYAKARRGEVIEIDEREVDVHDFSLQSAGDLLDAGEPLLRLHVECGSGTYVRSLVRDLGERLGCGAHVAGLRRLWVDPFRDPRMWTLDASRRWPSAANAASMPACCRSRVAWPAGPP